MSTRKGQPRDKARQTNTVKPQKLLLIVSEGEVTEVDYFDGLIVYAKNPLVRIQSIGLGSQTLRLVPRAKEVFTTIQATAAIEENTDLIPDKVWCVFDKDDKTDIGEALIMAAANNFSVAFSNPNFEVWLLMHFDNPPGAQHREQIRKLLCKHVPGYKKHVDFEDYVAGYQNVVQRAVAIEKRPDDEEQWQRNPSSGVFHLTREIVGRVAQFQE